MERTKPTREIGTNHSFSLNSNDFDKKYEKQSALNTIQFWWKLADWGSETGKTEYVPPKKKKV